MFKSRSSSDSYPSQSSTTAVKKNDNILYLALVNNLTSVNNFPKQILPPNEVLCGTVPPSVFELVLALGHRHVGPCCDCGQGPRVLSRQAPLLAPERRVDDRVHVQDPWRQR